MIGDGTIKPDGNNATYYTGSKEFANNMQEIIIKLGYGSYLTSRTREIKKSGFISTVYEVSRHTKTKGYWVQHKKGISEEYYDDFVYCAEVPNHSLMVRRNGKATWCGNSVGVVSLNCARLGYKNKDNWEGLIKSTFELMDLAKISLEVKRKTVTKLLESGLYPFSKRYLGTYRNHFSTIGVNGVNEMILNFTNGQEDITTPKGKELSIKYMDAIREKMIDIQKETKHMYNLEAVPAESAATRFAREDKKRFHDIIQQSGDGGEYYTNSTQLPVDFKGDIFEILDHQDELQAKYTGGTVLHLFMKEKISNAKMAKSIIKRVFENYKLPYLTLTPIFSVCPKHGYIAGEHEFCPQCDAELMEEERKRIYNDLKSEQK
jgi:anaerobic ribonucleoside-triphosphate reductase